jgi:hypothetical protein
MEQHIPGSRAATPPAPPPSPRPPPSRGAHLPLLAALIEIPWFLMVVVPMISAGASSPKGADTRLVALVMILPALAGLLAGIVVVARRQPRSQGQRLSLRVGCAVCGLIVLAFAWDRLNYLW